MRPQLHLLHVLLLFVARAHAQNGNGVKTGCTQTALFSAFSIYTRVPDPATMAVSTT